MEFKKYDADVGEVGLSNATRKLVEKFGEGIDVKFEQDAEACLSKDPVLVVGTHPGRLNASAVVAAMPERNDSFVVGNAMLERIGPNFNAHLIPVALVNRKRNVIKDLVRKAAGFPPRNTDSTAAKEKNQDSLKRAAQIVNDGGRVLIFPDNVHKRGDGRWLKGVGQLLQQLGPDKKIVFANADPSVKPLAVLKGKNMVSTEVKFSAPITVKELIGVDKNVDVDFVVKTIEQRYKEWEASGL